MLKKDELILRQALGAEPQAVGSVDSTDMAVEEHGELAFDVFFFQVGFLGHTLDNLAHLLELDSVMQSGDVCFEDVLWDKVMRRRRLVERPSTCCRLTVLMSPGCPLLKCTQSYD